MKKRLLILMTTIMLVCLMGLTVMAASVKRGTTEVKSITPTTTSTTYNYSFDQNDSYKDNYYGVVIPVTVTSSGYLEVVGTLNAASTEKDVTFNLYKDQACTTKPSDSIWCWLDEDDLTDDDDAYLAAGTYYLCISSTLYDDEPQFTNYGTFSMKFVSNADRSLANNTTTYISKKDNGTYLKISTPQAGYVTVKGTKSTYVSLHNSSKQILSEEYNSLNDGNSCMATFAVNKGTYYIRTKSYSDIYNVSYTFSQDPTWTASKSYTLTPADKKQYIYAKFKPTKSGYVTLNYSGKYSVYITLCDSKKKALSDQAYVSNYSGYKSAVFAVNKNTTYYFKVNASTGSKFTFKTAFTTVSEKSGSKVSKAVSIKKGKTAKGLILPGSSTKDYYKIVVSKDQKVSLKFTGKACTGTIRINVYSDSKLKRWVGTVYCNGASYSTTRKVYTSGSSKLRKGTYYIQVERSNSKTNGYYSIQWLK